MVQLREVRDALVGGRTAILLLPLAWSIDNRFVLGTRCRVKSHYVILALFCACVHWYGHMHDVCAIHIRGIVSTVTRSSSWSR